MARCPGFRSAPYGAVRSPSATAGPRVLPVGIYFQNPLCKRRDAPYRSANRRLVHLENLCQKQMRRVRSIVNQQQQQMFAQRPNSVRPASN